MNNFVSSIFLIIGLLTMNDAVAGKSTIYYLSYDINNVQVIVHLNDINVLTIESKGKTNAEKPIPEYIVNGKNSLKVVAKPLEGNDEFDRFASADIELISRAKDAPMNQLKIVSDVTFVPNEPEDNILKKMDDLPKNEAPILTTYIENKEVSISRTVEIISGRPAWVWEKGEIIDVNEKNFESLVNEYKKIYRLFVSKDLDKIKSYFSAAAKEYALAYDHEDEDAGHEIMNTGGLALDEEWGLGNTQAALQKRSYRLDVSANGRLAQIVDSNGNSPILFANKHVKMFSFQKYKFYMDEKKGWVMIR